MIQFRAKLWAGIGAAAFAAACQPPASDSGAAPSAAAPHDMAAMSAAPVGESGEGGGDLMGSMTPEDADGFRVAMMKGHLAAAMKLVDEGASKEGSMHFLHPIHEVYDQAKDHYAAKGLSLDTVKFSVAAENAALGKPASALRPMWEGLNKQVDALTPKKYSRAQVVKALLTQLSSEYRRGVEGPTVTNAPEYQDAYGFSTVALRLIEEAAREGSAGDATQAAELRREAEALVNMFPTASPPPNPAAPGEVQAQISRIQLAFPGME